MNPWLGGARPAVVGHRGAPSLASENTIASFRAAVVLGVDAVEFDVIAIGDGTLVVGHSTDLRELTHGSRSGSAADVGLADLRAVAPGLATLDEVLSYFVTEAMQTGIQVDLKTPARAADVARHVVARGLGGRSVLTSTDAAALRSARSEAPGLSVGLTYPLDRHGVSGRPGLGLVVSSGLRLARLGARRLPPRVARAGADAAYLHHAVISAAAVRRLHRAGAAVVAWTVDDPDTVIRLSGEGVDGIISNDPSMVLATLTS